MPLPLIVAFAACAVVDRPGVAFGWTAWVARRATGVPSPFAVRVTSWTGEPTGPNSTSDQTTSVLPSVSCVMRAPSACTSVIEAGRRTDSWATSGSATSCVTVPVVPSGAV